MARHIGESLPESVLEVLDDRHGVEAGEGHTFLLLSVTSAGWVHVAMLSVGEVLAIDGTRMRFALWKKSTAERNLTPSGKATLALVHANAAYTIRLDVRRGDDLEVGDQSLASFEGRVTAVYEDIAAYAVLDSGVRFHLTDPQSVYPRWQATVDALRSAGSTVENLPK